MTFLETKYLKYVKQKYKLVNVTINVFLLVFELLYSLFNVEGVEVQCSSDRWVI